jgi:hypothetical protein
MRWTCLDGHLEGVGRGGSAFARKSPSAIACLLERSSKHCPVTNAFGSVKIDICRSCYLRKRPFQRQVVSLHGSISMRRESRKTPMDTRRRTAPYFRGSCILWRNLQTSNGLGIGKRNDRLHPLTYQEKQKQTDSHQSHSMTG